MNPALFGLQGRILSKDPVLVIDRDGLIGEPLSLKLSKEFLTVFVSQKKLDLDIENQNIVHVPFLKKFPLIPDNKYSHIIFIDEEKQDLELLPKIINKVKDVNADFIFVQGLCSGGRYAADNILRYYPSAKVVLFGDIFDSKLILKKESCRSVINEYIRQAQKLKRMQVLGEGLKETYPVFLPDVVDGLIDLIFGMHKSRSLFYIFPKHPLSELSLAHMIQKINPEVTIDFIKHNPKLRNISFPPNGENLLGDDYQLAKKIREIDMEGKLIEQDSSSHGNAKKLNNPLSFIIWALIFVFLSPFIFTVFFYFLGLNTLHFAKGELNKGNFVSSKSSLHLSQTFYYLGKQTLNIFSFQAKIVGHENSIKKFSEDIDFGFKTSEALSQVLNSEAYFSKVLSGESKDPTGDFAKGGGCLKSSIIALGKIKAEGKIPAPILQNLEDLNPLIKLASNTVDIMPSILGMEKPKTYLILLQDNMELRPGGGVINSYGILKFSMGKIAEFSMHDVYDADGQLRGHVEPPFAIRRYLSEKHWYMKDSNFDVDFVKSASSSSNFLLVETEEKADGIIAVDASFIKNILHATGSVYVKDYKENVDEDNFYKLMLSHSQENSSLSVAPKRDFLRSIGIAIVAKIQNEKKNSLLIAQAISNALAQKHLLLSLSNSSQNIFTVNGWSSSLWDERRDSKDSINDFIGINEANLGFNNVNYFIKRLIAQKVIIGDDGNISEELTVNYKNESTAWPGGDYKNYLRIILPKNINLSEISINDKAQKLINAIIDPQIYEAKYFKIPQGLEVEKTSEENKTILGFVIKIPVGEIVKVKIKYTLAENIFGLNTFSYNLKLFKQPGIDSISYSFSSVYPKSFNINKASEKVIKGEGKALYSEKIAEDKNLIINFTKK